METPNDTKKAVIVVGGGLAGLSVAHTVLEAGGSVILIEQSGSIFPSTTNSSLSISGLNGYGSDLQKLHHGSDSLDSFVEDVIKSGSKRTDLLETLCGQSGPSLDWLSDAFGLDFVLSRSGGQSHARTHKIRDQPTGLSVVSAMAKKLTDISVESPERVSILCASRVTKLITDGRNGVVGVEFDTNGTITQLSGPVALCTGGFGSDFASSSSTIARYRPDLLKLSTACGLSTSKGDGIRLGETVGARLVDMMYIQVNPTGLVDPSDPSNRFKVVATESLRGDGAIILDKNGVRFVNELAKRDFLASEMIKRGGPFFIILNSRIARHVAKYIREHRKSGCMREVASGPELAAALGVTPEQLEQSFAEYNTAAEGSSDKFGKTHFRNTPFEMTDSFIFAQIEPVIQYCVGGLGIDASSAVLGRDGRPISGLFAAGEVTGGVHSISPMTGNDLVDCVVFGRIAGVSAATQIYGRDYVEQHMNPEVVARNLREAIAKAEKMAKFKRKELGKVRNEITDAKQRIQAENADVEKLCRKVAKECGELHPALAGLQFDPHATSPESILGLSVSASVVTAELRAKKLQAEQEVLRIARVNEGLSREAEEVRKQGNELGRLVKTAERKFAKLEKDVEVARNSSAVLREIGEWEAKLSDARRRQEEAEEATAEVEREIQAFHAEMAEHESKLVKTRDEMEVMARIEKVQVRKDLEALTVMCENMGKQAGWLKEVAIKTHELGSNKDCAIFQYPLIRPPTLTQ